MPNRSLTTTGRFTRALRDVPCDASGALAFAAECDRHADFLLSVGRTTQAEAAAHLAFEARCHAQGERA